MALASPMSHPVGQLQPLGYNPNPVVGAFTPSQIRHAYGFDQIVFIKPTGIPQFPYIFQPGDGTGQTIAIVDAYDDPTIASDVHVFDQKYGLPDPVLTKATPEGQPVVNGNWSGEISLDVEWSHAIAPNAKILLVEAKSASYTDLFNAVSYAAAQPGVSVVSMSFGGSEFAGETGYDSVFTTPYGHSGVTFVAASGDTGAPPEYPAASPNVLAVGGTALTLGANNVWSSEVGWSGSGGGVSPIEAKPSYQSGVTQSATQRTDPDVAYDADPNTGFSVYDSTPYQNQSGWLDVGGTSAGAPQWAAMIAIANQGRNFSGLGTLYGANYPLYKALPSSGFHDITTGNNGYAAGPGYDLVTGLGSPKAAQVVSGLVSYNPFGRIAISRLPAVSPLPVTIDPGPVIPTSAVAAVVHGRDSSSHDAGFPNGDTVVHSRRRQSGDNGQQATIAGVAGSAATENRDVWISRHPRGPALTGLLRSRGGLVHLERA
jgi:subtilase family serine protease